MPSVTDWSQKITLLKIRWRIKTFKSCRSWPIGFPPPLMNLQTLLSVYKSEPSFINPAADLQFLLKIYKSHQSTPKEKSWFINPHVLLRQQGHVTINNQLYKLVPIFFYLSHSQPELSVVIMQSLMKKEVSTGNFSPERSPNTAKIFDR